jgi:hypothetical protein
MAGKFADLRAKMSPEARARSAAKAQALLGGVLLPFGRRWRGTRRMRVWCLLRRALGPQPSSPMTPLARWRSIPLRRPQGHAARPVREKGERRL